MIPLNMDYALSLKIRLSLMSSLLQRHHFPLRLIDMIKFNFCFYFLFHVFYFRFRYCSNVLFRVHSVAVSAIDKIDKWNGKKFMLEFPQIVISVGNFWKKIWWFMFFTLKIVHTQRRKTDSRNRLPVSIYVLLSLCRT